MMRQEELESALTKIDQQIEALAKQQQAFRRDLAKLKSLDFIASNGIRKADVEMSDTPDKPWFGNVTTFAKWLEFNSTKQWSEWNGRIFRRADLVSGVFDLIPEGRVEELQD